MQANEMLLLARETRKKVREIFGDKAGTITAYDVDEPSRCIFKLKFVSHDYLGIRFNYEKGFCEFIIVLSNGLTIPLEDSMKNYSEIKDWDDYLRSIMSKIELRIPDKFLKARGWL